MGGGGKKNYLRQNYVLHIFFFPRTCLPNIVPVSGLELLKCHAYWFTVHNLTVYSAEDIHHEA